MVCGIQAVVIRSPSSLVKINDLWSSQQLQNVSGFDGENEELGETLQKRSVKYLCAVEVTLPHHRVRTKGVALGEADVENSGGTFWMQLEVSLSIWHRHWSVLLLHSLWLS